MHRVTVCVFRASSLRCVPSARVTGSTRRSTSSQCCSAPCAISVPPPRRLRRELPPEGLPALTRLEPLADGALSLCPPTLRRPRWEAELLTQLQQLAVALDGACPLVLDGSCGSHVTPSALSAPGELDAAASTTGFRFVDRIGPAQLVKDMERFAVGFEPCLTVHYQAASGTKFCSAGPRVMPTCDDRVYTHVKPLRVCASAGRVQFQSKYRTLVIKLQFLTRNRARKSRSPSVE
ncbi:uncharacterized protein LOC122388888 [Amphibalanus amphitrite]|uniref:uncharacterized protein LOC122388888 n=1 Tax=Amphibalanus amphitrite TaxID=1232801 RepID=UPI001C90196B|nr:uncharacterized protein LOC122388888 [Amphibalanus amphitrite]